MRPIVRAARSFFLAQTILFLGCSSEDTSSSTTSDAGVDVASVAQGLGATFQEVGGQVVIEAENHTTILNQGPDSWTLQSNTAASASLQMRAGTAATDNGSNVKTGFTTGSPRLNFDINFTSTGAHTVWIRGLGAGAALADSDSMHVGLNGVATTSADGTTGFVTGFTNGFTWVKAPRTLNVTSTGKHTVNVWMREDGFVFDKILLTTNAAMPAPTGTGPAESSTGTASCFDQIQNGTETGIDCGGTCAACSTFGLDLPRPSNTTCLAGNAPATGLQRIWSGITFNEPIGLVQEPGTRAFFVMEKAGTISRVASATATTKTTFLSLNVERGGEGGVWSMVFHPNYPSTSRYVYVSYSPKLGVVNGVQQYRMQISRFTTTTNPQGVTSIVPGTELVLWSASKSQSPFSIAPATGIIHNGGSMQFGPDGLLYMGVGDDRLNRANASITTSPYGKIIRLNVDAAAPYLPSTGNLNGAVWASGFRNPWRLSFDKLTGELWVADVGEDTFEEVNIISTAAGAPRIFGWPHWEADSCNAVYVTPPSTPTTGNCGQPNTAPEFKYAHNGSAKSITGGYVYRGSALAGFTGKYIYADFEQGTVFSYDRTTKTSSLLTTEPKGLAAFSEDLDGELYLLDYQAGRVLKMQTATGGGPGPSARLSQTGCFTTVANPPVPAPGVIPFSVAQPFWSDGVAKERLFALPNGTAFSVAPIDGDFTLPSGGVTIKHFKLPDGRYFETRFFVRYNNGTYGGYTYQWRPDQTEADLVDAAGLDTPAGTWPTQNWRYPSRGECLQCHTPNAGYVLGPETRQMNISNTYPSTGRTANQIDTLVHLGMLPSDMMTDSSKKLTPFPSISDTNTPIATRANAYLHVNCSSCHRPPGTGRATWNALFDVPFSSKGLCTPPIESFTGNSSERLVLPGNHDLSTTWLRAHQRTTEPMPPLGSFQADVAGTNFLASWIDQLTPAACPAPSTNLVTNPTFDANATGWTLFSRSPLGTARGVVWLGGRIRFYTDGSEPFADAQMYQALTTSVGQSYTASFDVATTGSNATVVGPYIQQTGGAKTTGTCSVPAGGVVTRCSVTTSITTAGSTRFGVQLGSNTGWDFTVDNASVIRN